MKIDLVGVGAGGNHATAGPAVQFSFVHRGQAFVRMRLSWDVDKSVVHPTPTGGPLKPRSISAGTYQCVLQVSAADLPGLKKTIDSDLLINDVLVARVTGAIADDQTVDRGVALFRLVVKS